MKPTYISSLCALVFLGLTTSATAGAQAVATASRTISPSVFVMGSGVFTGLNSQFTVPDNTTWAGGKNIAISAGGDLGIYARGRYVLGVEVRGRFPIYSGKIVGEKNVMGGIRVTREPMGDGHFRPYVDVLFGRGQMNYQREGYPVGNLLYTQTAGKVFAGGAGVEYDLTQHFSAKLDGQVERWSTPVAHLNSTYSTVISLGLVYRFGAGEGPR